MSGPPPSRQQRPSRRMRAYRAVDRVFGDLARSRIVRLLTPVLVLAAAAWIARKAFHQIQFAPLLRAVESTPPVVLLLSALLTVLSYACLAGQEWYALKLIRHPRSLAPTLASSFAGNVLSSFMGFGLATGAAVRLRLYRWARLKPRNVAALSLICSLANYLSGLVTLGLCVLLRPGPIAAYLHWPEPLLVALGLLALSPAAAWFLVFRHAPRRRRGGPTVADRAASLALNLGDWVFSGAALFVLAAHRLSDLPPFLAVFLIGSLIGSLAGIPGGVGVLEAAMLRYGGGTAQESAAALVLYRAIYFLGPLLITVAGLGVQQLRRLRSGGEGASAPAGLPERGGS